MNAPLHCQEPQQNIKVQIISVERLGSSQVVFQESSGSSFPRARARSSILACLPPLPLHHSSLVSAARGPVRKVLDSPVLSNLLLLYLPLLPADYLTF